MNNQKVLRKTQLASPSPYNVTGGLDVKDMFKYFTLETS